MLFLHENFYLRVGKQTIKVTCPNKRFETYLSEYFQSHKKYSHHDVNIKLSFFYQQEPIDIPDSLFNSKTIKRNKFILAQDIVLGSISTDKKCIKLSVNIDLIIEPVIRVFEQLFYQAFYNATENMNRKDFLVHSSGVIHNGQGFLFCGKSGSGKSTIAALSEEYTVINDEICCIETSENGPILHSTPFNGLYKNKEQGSAPLKAVFILEHGASHNLSETIVSEAIMKITSEIVPPMGLQEQMGPQTMEENLNRAQYLYNSVPVMKLFFTPDTGFWSIIDKTFKLSERNIHD